MNKRLTNVYSIEEDDYNEAPMLQTRIDQWRHIYGDQVIKVKHNVNPCWSETELYLSKDIGSNVIDTISNDLDDYIEHDKDVDGNRVAVKLSLNGLVTLT